MALTINSLTTLATLKTELSIVGAGEDTYLERLIEVASGFIQNYCNRLLYKEAGIEESVPGYGKTILTVSRPPIIGDITSIVCDGSTVEANNYKVLNANAGIIYNPTGWIWTAATLKTIERDPYSGSEDPLYTVTYDGGFVTPEQGGTQTLPFELEQACLDLAVIKYRSKGEDKRISAEKLLSYSVSYSKEELPASIKMVLDAYKRCVVE